jgi:hypothetical protein
VFTAALKALRHQKPRSFLRGLLDGEEQNAKHYSCGGYG